MATAQSVCVVLEICPNHLLTGLKTGSYAMVTAQNGVVSMTLHQVNGDGAGPYRCEFSSDMTTFQPMDVMVNVPGENSRSRARATDFPLVARMPTSLEPGVGIVRCQNSARAGRKSSSHARELATNLVNSLWWLHCRSDCVERSHRLSQQQSGQSSPRVIFCWDAVHSLS